MQDLETIKAFLDHHFRHFNAATVVAAARAWAQQLEQGNRMMLTLAGAMSTAELGISVAELIRRGKVHAICTTGANLEEDVFNLVAHDAYERIPDWRALSAEDERALLERRMNRVTDTCIPEEAAMRCIEQVVLGEWQRADRAGEHHPPHHYLYRLLLDGTLASCYQGDPAKSWLMAAARADLPVFVPGWEDSTLGNFFVAAHIRGEIRNLDTVEGGLHAMKRLVAWYRAQTREHGIGFFQVGGGIAGDFPICAVPLVRQDLGHDVKLWSYFCQISDSTTSYGSYSGAVPNEKITWGKLGTHTPRFIIESDATIVAPLVFAYVLAS